MQNDEWVQEVEQGAQEVVQEECEEVQEEEEKECDEVHQHLSLDLPPVDATRAVELALHHQHQEGWSQE